MNRIRDTGIADILPRVLREEPEVRALSHALMGQTGRLLDLADGLAVWYGIDELGDAACDLLAAELDTQYYDASLPIESKRRLVKGTFAWYMLCGTPRATEELVAAVFGEGTVIDEKEGYLFSVRTNAPMREEMYDSFAKMLDRVKNARSQLEGIVFGTTLRTALTLGAWAGSTAVNGLSVHGEWESEARAGAWHGAAAFGTMTTVIGG